MEVSIIGNKVFIKNLSDIAENIKDEIANIENTLQKKINKVKSKEGIKCCFESEDITGDIEKLRNMFGNIKMEENTNNTETEGDEERKKEKNILNKISKKITLFYLKEGNKNKTILKNIGLFMEKTEIIQFAKKMQKMLGSSCIIDDNNDCVFSGNYTTDTAKKEMIRKFIFENTKLEKEIVEI